MVMQEGVGWHPDARPGPFFAMLCLRRTVGTSTSDLKDVMTGLWEIVAGLKRGQVPGLPAEPAYAGGLLCTVGYGPRLFAEPGAEGAGAAELRECAFDRPQPGGGGAVLPGAGLQYASDATDNGADADVAVQLVADQQAAVTRAVVVLHRHLQEQGSVRDQGAAVNVSGAWLGYRREDRRSWLGFHDGVDNVNGPERYNTVTVGPAADDRWLRGGTYLAFLRLELDLDVWRALMPWEQELLVGREKATGVPLDPAGHETTAASLAADTTTVFARANLPIRVPRPVDLDNPSGLGGSHVQRTRRHPGLRIYRQGYEFLDIAGSPPRLQPGLNFVSFQCSPNRIVEMLRTPSWLGAHSFAGARPRSSGDHLLAVPGLLRARAAGIFAAPAADEGRLPGSAMLAAWG